MRTIVRRRGCEWVSAVVVAIALGLGCSPDHPTMQPTAAAPVSFYREVRPILAEHCFPCHGADSASRQAGLRLDSAAEAFATRPTGPPVIVKGDPAGSLLFQRISAADPARRMPPPSADWALSAQQVTLIETWITQGADYPELWALVNPQRPAIPLVQHADWPRNAIDFFVLANLEAAGLTPNPEADARALVRRASLDARGLPPRPDEVDAFLADAGSNGTDIAYQHLVDRWLVDPAYGEHRARYWLDLARYADTNGYFLDDYRSIWPYRDYVIRAFNDNLPFDRFTIEQLAGDLLPNPTVDQQVATGFGRCAMTTSEFGTIDVENEEIMAKDRVETTAAAWLGLTLGCAACHDHKFDPITQKDFYAFSAFFRNSTQLPSDNNQPDAPPAILVGPQMTPSLVTDEKSDGVPFAYVLARGQYDQPGEKVGAAVPRLLEDLAPGEPVNRLGLAHWLVSPQHPLTARVAVNQFWAQLFGVGIVATPANFGSSGSPPSNLPLLDWLAVELRESGWNVRHMFKLMLTSAAYRQSAVHNPAGDQQDPENLLLWHGPRFRLDAEVIRDQALAASGLLVQTIGGPPVKPYQPPGIWESVAMEESNTKVYEVDSGDARYRRSLYTFWKRTAPPPNLEIFNAPSREHVTEQRDRTSTPLQALVAMNDPQLLEAARHLALRAITAAGPDPDARLDQLGLLVLARPLDDQEHQILLANLATFTSGFGARPSDADLLLAQGDSPAVDSTVPTVEQAAWMLVASEILNLDEALNK
jgi:hypothetical protein